MKIIVSIFSFLAFLNLTFAQNAVIIANQQFSVLETWQGLIELPSNQKVDFVIKVLGPNKATISIPLQGVVDVPLVKFTQSNQEIAFSFDLAKATATFKREGDKANGTWQQGSALSKVSLSKIASINVLELWRGEVKLPNNQKLQFTIKVLGPNKALISLPLKNIIDAPLKEFAITDKEIHFSWELSGNPMGTFQHNNNNASGTWKESGKTLSAALQKMENFKVLETWQGIINPQNEMISFIIKILGPNTAMISIPAQKVNDAFLTEFNVSDKEIRFSWDVPGKPTWVLQRTAEGKAQGTMTQNGQTGSVTLEKMK